MKITRTNTRRIQKIEKPKVSIGLISILSGMLLLGTWYVVSGAPTQAPPNGNPTNSLTPSGSNLYTITQNIGIGTTTPGTALVVNGTSTIIGGLIIPHGVNPNTAVGSIAIDDTNSQFVWNSNSNERVVDGTGRGCSYVWTASTTDTGVILDRPLATTTITQLWCKTTSSTAQLAFKNNGVAFATTTCSTTGVTSSSLTSLVAGGDTITYDTNSIAAGSPNISICWYMTKARQ